MSKHKPTILMIDDEPYYTMHYREMLDDAGFIVDYHDRLSSASLALGTKSDNYAAMILDLMMPRPEDMSSKSWEDFMAMPGAYFLSRASNIIFENRIPVLVFSNRFPHDFRELWSGNKFAPIPRQAIAIEQKMNISAMRLPEWLSDFINRAETNWDTWTADSAST